jgi:hypothetical protein
VKRLAIALAALLLAACSPQAARTPLPTLVALPTPETPSASPVRASVTTAPAVAIGPAGPPPDPNTVAVPPAGSCHLTPDGLPDHACTPGLLNPNLTAAQLCAPGFTTKTIRPPVSYTGPLKKRLMISYGIGDKPEADYELDHLVSLEDLGSAWAPANLWPQERQKTLPGGQATGIVFDVSAEAKDQVETRVHRDLCAASGDPARIAALQAQLAFDWRLLRPTGVSVTAPDAEPTKEPEP